MSGERAGTGARASALIVAGGRATRLGGVDKRTLVVDGLTIFERQCQVLAPRVVEIVVSARTAVEGYRTVHDAVADAGPIAGIAAGLAVVATPWLLVVAGDMPHLREPLIDLLLARAVDAVDAVGIRIDGRPEPLLCALRVAAARPAVERRLAQRRFKASGVLEDEGLVVAWIEGPELCAVDPDHRAMFNVNTPADLSP